MKQTENFTEKNSMYLYSMATVYIIGGRIYEIKIKKVLKSDYRATSNHNYNFLSSSEIKIAWDNIDCNAEAMFETSST